MPFKWSLFFLTLIIAYPAIAEVSLSDVNHNELGDTLDPSVGRQAAPSGSVNNLEQQLGNCFQGRGDFSSGGDFGRAALATNVSTPIRVADSDPELAKGGTFDLEKVKQSLLGLDGLSGRCAKCHNTGKASPKINSGTLDTPGGLAMILKALTVRSPPMPKDNPGFRTTPEGIAVINFLTAQGQLAAKQ